MSFHNWLQGLRYVLAPSQGRCRHRRRVALQTAGYRPGIEVLEDRSVPAFLAPVSYDVDTNPQAVVTADFDGDGRLDLATANTDSNSVSVLLGNADGSFQPGQTSATGPYPISLAAGDFNADGKLDLATANWDGGELGEYGNNAVNILLGKGDGTFAAPVVLSISVASAYPWSIATGDLDADGKLDLVVTSDDDGFGGYVDVLLGHGDGSFAAAATYGPYHGQSLVNQLLDSALADVNGDGKIDVAVTGYHSNSVKIFLGKGDGTLQEPSDFATGLSPGSLAAGDFNADGKLDLVTANYSNSVSMLLGNGDGTFQAARSFAAGSGPQSATTSDVNGDGKLDLVVTNPAGGAVSVLLGNGDGSLAQPITSATGGSGANSVVMADFNGDGRPDAAAANQQSQNLSVLLNDGNWDGAPLLSIGIGDVSLQEGASKKTTLFSFTVTLSAPSTETVTVNFTTANGTALAGSDYVAKSGTVTFLPGETTKTVTISVKGDTTKEADETFFVNLSGATNGQIADGQGVGTILNDDSGGGGGKKRTSASAVDAAISDWLSSADKQRKA